MHYTHRRSPYVEDLSRHPKYLIPGNEINCEGDSRLRQTLCPRVLPSRTNSPFLVHGTEIYTHEWEELVLFLAIGYVATRKMYISYIYAYMFIFDVYF